MAEIKYGLIAVNKHPIQFFISSMQCHYPLLVRLHFQGGNHTFVMYKIDRDRHYARWKKAVQRTMKWEVNDDETQGID